MACFVLIHGAMHGGWCWERVIPRLQAEGHEVIAPDLPGLGADRTPASDVTLERWGRFVAGILQTMPGRVILAGHSLGGMAISQAAELAPERIAALAYVTALLPRDGESPFQLTQRHSLPGDKGALVLKPTQDGQYVTAEREAAQAAFYDETPPEWAERALSRLVPQPLGVLREAVRLSASKFGSVPRAYIECLRDKIIDLEVQRSMQATSPCAMVDVIDADHSPFYSRPEELSKIFLTGC